MLAQRSADGVHGFVDDLTESELEGDAAEDVGVYVGETPPADQEVDHAAGGGTSGVGNIGPGLDDDPGVGSGIMRGEFAGFNNGAGKRLLLVEFEPERHIERAFDAIDADFAIALCGMAVSATEQRSVIEDGQVEG